jgi:hypothetical protein
MNLRFGDLVLPVVPYLENKERDIKKMGFSKNLLM